MEVGGGSLRPRRDRPSWTVAAVAAACTALPALCFARGDGTLVAAPRIPVAALPVAIEAGDWNLDGKLDLIALSGTAPVWTTVQDSRERDLWSPPTTIRMGSTPYAAHAADVNGD